jgi:hypothetical protein
MASLPPWQRIGRGALMGLVLPGAFTILILYEYLHGGRYQNDGRSTTDVLVLLIAYPIGSVIMGAVLGFGTRFIRSMASATVVGMLAIAPLLIGCGLSLDDGHWEASDTIITAILTVVFGAALGHGVLRARRNREAAESA